MNKYLVWILAAIGILYFLSMKNKPKESSVDWKEYSPELPPDRVHTRP
jgi:hypothetical protein